MAYIGLRKPWVAKYNKSNKTYSDGFKYSHAVSVNVTPNYAEASLYGDDMQVEYEKSLTNATIQLGTTSTPIEAAKVIFGHEVNGQEVIYNATDEANYVGVGFVSVEKVDGDTKYVGAVITCSKFSDATENYTTKGEQLQFNTPTIEGKAIPDEDGMWKKTKVFDAEADAESYVKGILNITEPTTTHSVTQNLTNVTSSLSDMTVGDGESLEATLTAESGYTMSDVVVTMGGTDISSSAWDSDSGKVSITSVTGDVVITANATGD